MQSTGQTSTHELSLTPMHGSAITYVTFQPRSSEGVLLNQTRKIPGRLFSEARDAEPLAPWLLAGSTVRVTSWPSRRARDCSHSWRPSAARRGTTSSQWSWDFIPVACVSIWSACTPPVSDRARASAADRGASALQLVDRAGCPAGWRSTRLLSAAGAVAGQQHPRRPGTATGGGACRTGARARAPVHARGPLPCRGDDGPSAHRAGLRSPARARRTGPRHLSARELSVSRRGAREPARRVRAAPRADAWPAGSSSPRGRGWPASCPRTPDLPGRLIEVEGFERA